MPALISSVVEPAFGVLADGRHRRILVTSGGVCFCLSLIAASGAPSFGVLLGAFIVLYPASGAFVSLSQATLMDLDGERREINMARWTLAGSIGVVAGPLMLSLVRALGGSWRVALLLGGLVALPLIRPAGSISMPSGETALALSSSLRAALSALRRAPVLRWLVLLEAVDLLLDIFLGFLALYFVDVVRTDPFVAGLAVAIWTAAGLIGDALLLPLLKRWSGVAYLRLSATAVLVCYPAFLVAPGTTAKLVLVAALGLLNAGWYAIPMAGLFDELGDRSGAAIALANIAGVLGSVIPLALGVVADRYGLETALWLLVAAPITLLALMPRARASS